MRRVAAVLLTVAALVAGFAEPAGAATTTVVAKILAVDDATASGVTTGTMPCATSGLGSQSTHGLVIGGPADPNAQGTSVSWSHAGALTGNSGWGVATAPGTAQDLGVFKIDVYNGPSGTAAILVVDVDTTIGQPTTIWVGKTPIAAGTSGQWATIDEGSATFDWERYTVTGAGDGGLGTSTLSAFAATNPDGVHDRHFYGGFFVFGCYGETGWAINHIQTGTPASVVVTDLGTLTNPLHASLPSNFVVAGSQASVDGVAQYVAGPSVTLNYRTLPGTSYAQTSVPAWGTAIDDLKCSPDGSVCNNPFYAMVKPLHDTIYKWSYPAAQGVDGAVSGYVYIHVIPKLTPSWPATAVHHGHAFAVAGTTYPAKPGSVVTLWGKHGSTIYKLGTATVAANGSFRLVGVPSAAGSWAFWVTIPAGTGNAAGKSAMKGIAVS